ncbi:uncharacterized protein [Dysidea avara]|uniref:uncharacterized protein isoform X2 n=1 Tax=Dysidea avara TaxID=196820 RepID=UPI00332BF6A7
MKPYECVCHVVGIAKMKLLQLPLSQLLLLWLSLLTTLVGVSIQRCAVEDINVMDLVLSTESIEVTHMPNINITDIYYNCLSTSRTVGLYSSASLSVVYNRSKPAAMLEVRYNVQCIRGYWHRVGRTTTTLRSNDTRTDCYSCTDQSVNETGQTPEEDGEDGLSKVAIVGIVIFCIAALIVLTVTVTVGVRHVWRSGKNKADSQQIYQPKAD